MSAQVWLKIKKTNGEKKITEFQKKTLSFVAAAGLLSLSFIACGDGEEGSHAGSKHGKKEQPAPDGEKAKAYKWEN